MPTQQVRLDDSRGRSGPDSAARGRLRLLVRLVCAVIFVDTVFFAVVAPLLPELANEFGFSKLGAGVLTAGYAVGTMVGSLPAGVLAARVGPRAALLVGLVLLGLSSMGFGLANDIVLLDLARVIQGIGGAFIWVGGLGWLVEEAQTAERGRLIGIAVAAGTAGTVLGPAMGAAAHAVGRPALFVGLAAVAGGLALAVRANSSHSAGTPPRVIKRRRELVRPVIFAMWLVLIPGVVQAVLAVLGPLRMDQLGAATGFIGLTFVIAGGLEAAASISAGRYSDRHGMRRPILAGLIPVALFLPAMALSQSWLLFSGMMLIAMTATGLFWAPALAYLSEVGEALGLPQGVAFALTNLAWALGAVIGGIAGGAIANAAGDSAALGAVALLCLATAVWLVIHPLPVISEETRRPPASL